MKLKSATIFTGIYLIHYDIVHLVSARIESRSRYTSQSVIACQGCF